jgi:hypothetical protein
MKFAFTTHASSYGNTTASSINSSNADMFQYNNLATNVERSIL